MVDNVEFIQDFLEEAKTHIENLEMNLVNINKEDSVDETINVIFRSVHSIKGTAGFFGLEKVVKITHAMENIFGEIRKGKMSISEDIVDVSLNANDVLKGMMEDILNSNDVEVGDLLVKLSHLMDVDSSDSDSAISQKTGEGELTEGSAESEQPLQQEQQMQLEQQDFQMKQCEKKNESVTDNDKSERTTQFNWNKNKLQEAIIDAKHGKHLYEIAILSKSDILSVGEELGEFIKRLEMFGEILSLLSEEWPDCLQQELINKFEESSEGIKVGFLIHSVLEKNLLIDALETPESGINEIIENKSNAHEGKKEETSEKENTTKASITKPNTTNTKVELQKAESQKADGEKPVVPNAEDKKSVVSLTDKKPVGMVAEDSIRVQVGVLNSLLDMASEMVLGRNQLLRLMTDIKKDIPSLTQLLQNIDRLTTGMQERIMQTRMQPVSVIFNKFPKLVRDLSKNLKKDIELVMEGKEVELDKTVLEALADPLVHLVRNSADHGLELPEIRRQKGKNVEGTITLRAFHNSGCVNLEISDDGRGIDPDVIKEKAIQKGIITRAEGERLLEKDILKLVFKPGFSTAELVTDISGRGVGMDVVKTNVEKIGGAIEVTSDLGIGTKFRLTIPLTLAIIQSLIVEVEGVRYVLPQANIQEVVMINSGEKNRKTEFIRDVEVLRLRGRLIPLIHLSEILKLNNNRKKKNMSVNGENPVGENHMDKVHNDGLHEGKNFRSSRLIILKINQQKFGIAVDAILGSEEILVKPLPAYMKECGCYSGVTIMGDGKTSMILDPEGIYHLAAIKMIEADSFEAESQREMEIHAGELQNLFLFKCSGSENFCVDLAVVSRIKKIKKDDIERIGNKEFIPFGDESLRVIRIEDYLPFRGNENDDEQLFVLIPKMTRHPIGIIFNKKIGTMNVRIHLDTEEITAEGILGTTYFDNKTLIVLNLYELFKMVHPEFYETKSQFMDENKKVLLVEDTVFFQTMIKKYLEFEGFETVVVSNGLEGLNALEEQEFSLVLSDLQMPIMDGLTFVRKMRENEKYGNLPVIAVTSMSGEKHKMAALESGFDYYESKQDLDSLMKVVHICILDKKRGDQSG